MKALLKSWDLQKLDKFVKVLLCITANMLQRKYQILCLVCGAMRKSPHGFLAKYFMGTTLRCCTCVYLHFTRKTTKLWYLCFNIHRIWSTVRIPEEKKGKTVSCQQWEWHSISRYCVLYGLLWRDKINIKEKNTDFWRITKISGICLPNFACTLRSMQFNMIKYYN